MIKKSLSVLVSYLPSKRNLSDLSIVIIKSGCPGGREGGGVEWGGRVEESESRVKSTFDEEGALGNKARVRGRERKKERVRGRERERVRGRDREGERHRERERG